MERDLLAVSLLRLVLVHASECNSEQRKAPCRVPSLADPLHARPKLLNQTANKPSCSTTAIADVVRLPLVRNREAPAGTSCEYGQEPVQLVREKEVEERQRRRGSERIAVQEVPTKTEGNSQHRICPSRLQKGNYKVHNVYQGRLHSIQARVVFCAILSLVESSWNNRGEVSCCMDTHTAGCTTSKKNN